jgi:GH15 family glucan-1,4-alpha-glucosidase
MTEVTRGEVRVDTAALTRLAERSVELILSMQDASGAYPASPTFSAYSGYSWFRDGAFIADAMSIAGAVDSANGFFDWCCRTLVSRADAIDHIVAMAAAGSPVDDDEMLAARFTFAGEEGVDEWWDFQLDGYGTWLWAVITHAKRHDLDLDRWSAAIRLTVEYLLSSWQRPCFDWWEEHAERVHVSTLGCIVAGLESALDAPHLPEHLRDRAAETAAEIRALMETDGVIGDHLAKWLGSTEVDASLLAIVAPLGVFAASGPIGLATVRAVESELTHDHGVHRYLADTYFGGGQWPLLSCFLGLAYSGQGKTDRAIEQLAWAAGTADGAGNLPEQVIDHLLDPSMRQGWVDRWGPVANPLLWSHAMYIRLAVETGVFEQAPS